MSNATKPKPGNTTVVATELAQAERTASLLRVQKYAETKKLANGLEATIKSIKGNVEDIVKKEGGAVQVTIFPGQPEEKLVSVQLEERNNQRCGKDMAEVNALGRFSKKLIESVMVADPKKVQGLLDAKLISAEDAEALLQPCTTNEGLFVRDVKKG
jgi:hypothetical protein